MIQKKSNSKIKSFSKRTFHIWNYLKLAQNMKLNLNLKVLCYSKVKINFKVKVTATDELQIVQVEEKNL